MSRRRPCLSCRVPDGGAGLPGVWGAARTQGLVWNRRGPSAHALSGRDRLDKPMVKPAGVQRESDGVVVPVIAARNAVGGKGPDFDHAGGVGKCEGMTSGGWSNHPGRPGPVDADRSPVLGEPRPVKVRELQRKLWAAAKQSEGRRFHALYDRVHRGDVLWEAWERVRTNRGAAGVDKVTLAAVEDYGVDRMLRELSHDLQRGSYRPAPVRRVEIPKPDGRRRPLGIPTVRDGSPSRRPRSCWNRSSRPTSCRARTGSGRNGPRPMPWSGSGCRSPKAGSSSSRPTSGTSSAASTTTG